MSITIARICDAIETTLATATTVMASESYDELAEGIHDFPTLQVYWESSNQSEESSTDRFTFQAGCRQTNMVIHADYYARQRSHINEDNKAVVDGADAIINVLENQNTKPYFGLDGLQSFRWEASRVIFVYGDAQTSYVGIRFMIAVRVF